MNSIGNNALFKRNENSKCLCNWSICLIFAE